MYKQLPCVNYLEDTVKADDSFFEKIDSPKLLATQAVWEQDLIAENEEVYRGEYLAWLMFKELVMSEKE